MKDYAKLSKNVLLELKKKALWLQDSQVCKLMHTQDGIVHYYLHLGCALVF